MKSVAGRPAAILLTILVVAALSGVTRPAAAQSQAELRRENERLQAKVEDLEREIERLRKSNQDLEQALRTARQSGSRPAPAPPKPEKVSIDESVPSASPRALARAMTEDYATTTKDAERGDTGDDPKRIAYLRTVDRWSQRMNREHRTPIEWHVRVIEGAQRLGGGYVIRLQAVDPETDVQLGDPFDAFLSTTVAGRLSQRLGGAGDDVFILKGTLVPAVRVNPDRAEKGPFDNPPLVGAYAEFRLGVTVQTMLPKPEPEKEEKAGTGGAQPRP